MWGFGLRPWCRNSVASCAKTSSCCAVAVMCHPLLFDSYCCWHLVHWLSTPRTVWGLFAGVIALVLGSQHFLKLFEAFKHQGEWILATCWRMPISKKRCLLCVYGGRKLGTTIDEPGTPWPRRWDNEAAGADWMEGGGLSGEAASDERCPVVDTYLAGFKHLRCSDPPRITQFGLVMG